MKKIIIFSLMIFKSIMPLDSGSIEKIKEEAAKQVGAKRTLDRVVGWFEKRPQIYLRPYTGSDAAGVIAFHRIHLAATEKANNFLVKFKTENNEDCYATPGILKYNSIYQAVSVEVTKDNTNSAVNHRAATTNPIDASAKGCLMSFKSNFPKFLALMQSAPNNVTNAKIHSDGSYMYAITETEKFIVTKSQIFPDLEILIALKGKSANASKNNKKMKEIVV